MDQLSDLSRQKSSIRLMNQLQNMNFFMLCPLQKSSLLMFNQQSTQVLPAQTNLTSDPNFAPVFFNNISASNFI